MTLKIHAKNQKIPTNGFEKKLGANGQIQKRMEDNL